MHKYLIIVCLIVVAGCFQQSSTTPEEQAALATVPVDSCQTIRQELADVTQQLTNLQADDERQSQRIDSLSKELFLANFKVEKVRYYLNICLKNKTQDKYLKGWVRRALD